MASRAFSARSDTTLQEAASATGVCRSRPEKYRNDHSGISQAIETSTALHLALLNDSRGKRIAKQVVWADYPF